ncbi:putative transcriptional regulator [Nautilia profundicola AmH]|uniref:Transcriptional regulator n=1 Tax=Nautilia profundicola (strain ATCC BAA-1463 / DSM 18972 / AmH) TaxID=598659 RepID=B9L9P9_NAUPA|nr:helix-turn-helix transcriptional regulator [Nautilia profundicola]ACM93730.1 putative transcriptional regulator [Nautilia profundicola AmH]
MNFHEFENILKKIKLTKQEFANFLDIDNTTISKWKNNKYIPKYAEIAIKYLLNLQKNCIEFKNIKDKYGN